MANLSVDYADMSAGSRLCSPGAPAQTLQPLFWTAGLGVRRWEQLWTSHGVDRLRTWFQLSKWVGGILTYHGEVGGRTRPEGGRGGQGGQRWWAGWRGGQGEQQWGRTTDVLPSSLSPSFLEQDSATFSRAISGSSQVCLGFLNFFKRSFPLGLSWQSW